MFCLGTLTDSANLVPGISHTARYTNSGNQTGEPACVFSRSCCPVQAKTASALLGVNDETLAYDSDSGVDLLSSTTYVDFLVIRIPT